MASSVVKTISWMIEHGFESHSGIANFNTLKPVNHPPKKTLKLGSDFRYTADKLSK